MRQKTLYHSSEVQGLTVKLETICDKLGNVHHCVTACDENGVPNRHYYFSKLISAFDFINSNFQ